MISYAATCGLGFAAGPAPCTVGTATDQVEVTVTEYEARAADAMKPMIAELEQLTKKATIPDKAIADQLTPREAGRFAEISQQIKGIRIAQFVESEHQRDALVVRQMFDAAQEFYVDSLEPSPPSALPTDADKVPSAIVLVMRAVFPDVKPQYSALNSNDCTVENALKLAEFEAVKQFNVSDPLLTRDLQLLEQIKAKYGIQTDQPVDATRLASEDVRVVQRIATEMRPVLRQGALTTDLQNILDWWRVAELVYTSRKEAYPVDSGGLHNGPDERFGRYRRPMRAVVLR
jgi:hypothetical protein